jgi:hypothetical protein
LDANASSIEALDRYSHIFTGHTSTLTRSSLPGLLGFLRFPQLHIVMTQEASPVFFSWAVYPGTSTSSKPTSCHSSFITAILHLPSPPCYPGKGINRITAIFLPTINYRGMPRNGSCAYPLVYAVPLPSLKRSPVIGYVLDKIASVHAPCLVTLRIILPRLSHFLLKHSLIPVPPFSFLSCKVILTAFSAHSCGRCEANISRCALRAKVVPAPDA